MVKVDDEDMEIPISVTICRENVKLPFYANAGDAGMDIVAAEEVIIAPGQTKLIPTGIKVAIPRGYEIQVRPRSGLSLNTPLRIPNSPGTIDSGFRDEIKVLMTNESKCFDPKPSDLNNDDTSRIFAGKDPVINFSTEINAISSKVNTEGGSVNDQDMSVSDKGINTAPELYTVSSKGNLQGTYKISPGDRIAQIVLQRVPSIKWQIVESVEDIGHNRGGGFGSSGVK